MIMNVTIIIHMIIVSLFGGLVDSGVFGSLIAFVFIGAVFISIGLLLSAVTENQIIAAIMSMAILFFMQYTYIISMQLQNLTVSMMGMVNPFGINSETISNIGQKIADAVNWLDPYSRMDVFSVGIFELTPLVFCVSMAMLFIYLTYRVLEKRRWGKG
jgi:ABC-2 type transport system permease protein